jgi:hypothetical protein
MRMEFDAACDRRALYCRVLGSLAVGAFPNLCGLADLAFYLIDIFLGALCDFVAGGDCAVQLLLRAFH